MIATGRCLRSIVGQVHALQGSAVRYISAHVQEPNQMVVVKQHENDQHAMKFPGIWLRDNCVCDKCYHKESLSRLPMHWSNFDTKVKVQKITTGQNVVHIDWSDKHKSTFDLNWLKERDFSPESHDRYIREWYRPNSLHWGKEDFQKILLQLDYKDVMGNDEALSKWLEALAVRGICKLTNSPLDIDVVKSLAERIGFIRRTSYGEKFSVKHKANAKNYSYLSEPLPLHTDMPYYEYKPSVTILHTLEQSQSQGGWNTLTDAFNVADQLRTNYPEHFKLLTETRVDWCDIGADGGIAFHNIWRAPVINLDADGKYARINHSIPQRDNHFSVDIDKVVPWYKANAQFVRMAQEQAVTFKTQPGDVLTFNNLRMLHGRTGYDDTELNVRHIVGCFVDWDVIYSKIRVLKKQLQQTRANTSATTETEAMAAVA